MVDLDTIEKKYNLFLYRKTICTVDGYSHISKVSTDSGNVYIKEVKGTEHYIRLLEKTYSELSKSIALNVPLLTKENKYVCDNYENHKFIVLPEVDETRGVPTTTWWASVLHEIHGITINENKGCFNGDDFFSLKHRLYLKAVQYMPKDIVKMINYMLQLMKCNVERKTSNVINHGDPLRSNIMKKNGRFLLIDFENVCIEPKEYDLQRHLWDFAVNSPKNEIVDYYRTFVNSYQMYDAIDFELLHDVFILDFCRTVCWLYVVCNDCCRADLNRQKYELVKFVDAMRIGKITEMLNCMR